MKDMLKSWLGKSSSVLGNFGARSLGTEAASIDLLDRRAIAASAQGTGHVVAPESLSRSSSRV